MIRCKIELGEEVCPEYAASYIGDYEFEIESLIANFDGTERSTITMDIGTISCLELRANGTFQSLLRGGGNYGQQGSSID